LTGLLNKKQVLITGASRGIGEGLAEAFVTAGATVHVLAEDETVKAVAQRLGATGHIADITDEKAIARVFSSVPQLDVLINNAGLERMTPLDDRDQTTLAVFRRIIEVNVVGTTIVTQAALEKMGAGGSIINTSSVWGRSVEPKFGAYVSSKHAVLGLTKTWSRELGPRGIRVNAVCPGWVKTESSLRSASVIAARSGKSEASIIEAVEAGQSLPGGLMVPSDIAGAYLFLASDLSANITGQSFGVDRGEFPW
jgi:3-hydroxybutyrate dehydrogenase